MRIKHQLTPNTVEWHLRRIKDENIRKRALKEMTEPNAQAYGADQAMIITLNLSGQEITQYQNHIRHNPIEVMRYPDLTDYEAIEEMKKKALSGELPLSPEHICFASGHNMVVTACHDNERSIISNLKCYRCGWEDTTQFDYMTF